MHRVFSSLLAIGFGLTSIIVPVRIESVWAQNRTSQSEELLELQKLLKKEFLNKTPQQAIETWERALEFSKQQRNKPMEALVLSMLGFNLRAIGQFDKALTYFNQALSIWQTEDNQAGESFALAGLGSVYNNIGQPQKALEYFSQALLKAQAAGDQIGEAMTLTGIGEAYIGIGQPQKALEYFNRSLPIIQAVGDRIGFSPSIGEARILSNIGGVYGIIGQPQKALEYFNRALLISQTANDRTEEAFTLVGIGQTYSNIGQTRQALKYFNQALPISQSVGDWSGEAASLTAIGGIYKATGQPQKALEYINRALLLWQRAGNKFGEANTLNNIGLVYSDIGQYEKALKYFEQALPINQAAENRLGEATTLNNIGLVYGNIGQYQKALEYFNRALPINQAAGYQLAEAGTLNNIGVIYNFLGQYQKALEYFNRALPINQAARYQLAEAGTLNNIGQVYSEIGQFQQALRYSNQALLIARAVGDREGESTILSNIGFAYRDTNRSTEAIANLEQSIKLKLQIRSGLLREQRQSFVQAKVGADIGLVSLLIERQETERAYQWVNLTATAELADYTRLLNAKVANPEAQAAINEWNQKNQQLQFLRQRLGEQYSDGLALQIRTLEAEENQTAESIARRFPETAELFETTPADIAQLQASIPVGTTVIHPVLLSNIRNVPDAIALFILTRDQLQVVKTAVDPKTFNALLTQTSQQLNDRWDSEYLSSLADLYDQLIRPIEAQIQATQPKQLSIITTGKLRYLPFEALYDQKTEQYLIQKYPVSYLTRLSSRSLASQNQNNATVTKRILAIGNPVPKDPLALPASETEVQDIVKTISGSEAMIREQATLAAFKLQALRFPWLHLATHGCFRPQGCCLGTPEECQKSPRIDLPANTILFADQPFNIADAALLGLQNVDLITLSACQTALETNSNGEEIAGLAYLFERAGAKATIASLWSAEDTTTQAIMVQFYQNLKQGMSKGEALQKAKLSQIASHPFFWAPFVLIGDAR